jgi:hypothetical protein
MDCGFYKQITGFPGYYINIWGQVYVERWDRYINQKIDKDGYYVCKLRNETGRYDKFVHRLLAQTFLEPIEGCNVIDHIDRDAGNNSLSNLRWTTHRGNMRNRRDQSPLGHNIEATGRKKSPFRVRINKNGKKVTKSFSTLEEAVKYRDSF